MRYIYFDQSTISRLHNPDDTINMHIAKLSNHHDFTIILSFEHIIESSVLGLSKKKAISSFLRKTRNVRLIGDPITFLIFSIESLAQKAISTQLNNKTWKEILKEESDNGFKEIFLLLSDGEKIKELHKSSHQELIEKQQEIVREYGNMFNRNLTQKELTGLQGPLPQEFLDLMKKLGLDEKATELFLSRLGKPLKRGEWNEFAIIEGILRNALPYDEISFIYEKWSAEKSLSPALTFYSLMFKKHGNPKSGDFSDAKHMIMIEFVDYLITDQPNINYLKRQLDSDAWQVYISKLITNQALENVW